MIFLQSNWWLCNQVWLKTKQKPIMCHSLSNGHHRWPVQPPSHTSLATNLCHLRVNNVRRDDCEWKWQGHIIVVEAIYWCLGWGYDCSLASGRADGSQYRYINTLTCKMVPYKEKKIKSPCWNAPTQLCQNHPIAAVTNRPSRPTMDRRHSHQLCPTATHQRLQHSSGDTESYTNPIATNVAH